MNQHRARSQRRQSSKHTDVADGRDHLDDETWRNQEPGKVARHDHTGDHNAEALAARANADHRTIEPVADHQQAETEEQRPEARRRISFWLSRQILVFARLVVAVSPRTIVRRVHTDVRRWDLSILRSGGLLRRGQEK